MFVTVRFGEEKSQIFNAQCKNENLLDNMKLQCGCGQKEVIDVADERGEVKDLRKFPTDYGSNFLKERETLVLLTVEMGTPAPEDHSQSGDDKVTFTPHLVSLRNDKEFTDSLNHDLEAENEALNHSGNRRHRQSVDGEDDVFHKGTKGKGSKGAGLGKRSMSRKSTRSSLKKSQ